VGHIAGQVAIEGDPRSDRERPWVKVPGEIEIEEWVLPGGHVHA